ncbi:hypothetical protein [Halochromatium roseum]|uniref:hypothetical protein n=1 Tax=Halochromatium roseum TaxID=391920 RepID=UPI001912590E|nr:hypothetical protein [Halochromatium roseum]MBK5938124.1 hypothetical protein [Halochromatium roseum]
MDYSANVGAQSPLPSDHTPIRLTRITAASGRTSKLFRRDDDGSLVKLGAGNVTQGTAARVTVDGLPGLAALLDSLDTNEAVAFGVHNATTDTAPLTIAAKLSRSPGAVARARQCFEFAQGEPGVLMCDLDGCTLTPSEAIATLRALHPALASADILWRASSSSGIYSLDDQIDTGLNGQRCYVIIDDAARIPEAAETIRKAMWAAGHGRIEIGRVGQLLERGLLDFTVYQPERFDFAAAPILLDGLGRAVPEPFISRGNGDGLLHADALTIDDATAARADQAKAEAVNAAKHSPERAAIKGAYVEAEAKRTAKRDGISEGDARARIERRIETGELTPADRLLGEHGREVRVSELIANPASYHNTRFADPLEPDYRADRRVAVFFANPDGSLTLFSHAHGGRTYRIVTDGKPQGTTADEDAGPNHFGPSLLDDLAELKPGTTTAVAAKLGAKHAWRCPWQLTATALADAICTAAPFADRINVLSAINRRIDAGARDARAPITLTGAEPITVADFQRIAEEAARDGGIIAVKSPHASGKTRDLLAPLVRACEAAGQLVVSITNRVSLTGANAQVLGLTDYRALDRSADGLSICVNSITNPRFSAWIDHADAVLIDEAAAVLRDIHARGSTMGSDAPAVRERLAAMLNRAGVAVLADADLSDTDLATLRELTGRPIRVVAVPETERALVGELTNEARAVAEIITQASAGKRVLVPCDSARQVEAITAYLRSVLPGKRVLGIHSRTATATSGREDVRELLRDINANAASIDVLLYTPVVESGVSLQRNGFDCHIALYCGTVSPAAFNQMLLRDRAAAYWLIGIVGAGTRGEAAANRAALRAMHDQAAALNEAETGIAPGDHSAFDAASVRYEAMQARASSHYGQALWVTLAARGWTMKRGERATSAERATAKVALEQGVRIANDQAAALILASPDIDAGQYLTLKERYSVNQIEAATIARFEIMGTFGTVTRREIDLYQRGRISRQLSRFVLLRQGATRDRDNAQAENGLARALRAYDAATAAGCRALFERLGIDPEDGSSAGVLTAARAMDVWTALKGTDEAAALERAGVCRFRTEPKTPTTWVSRALRKFGLSLAKFGQTRADGRLYQIEFSERYNDDTGEITTPGWDVLTALEAGAEAYLAAFGRHTSDTSALSPKCDGALRAAVKDDPGTDPDALIDRLMAILDDSEGNWRAAA